jgi:hypothetical protein
MNTETVIGGVPENQRNLSLLAFAYWIIVGIPTFICTILWFCNVGRVVDEIIIGITLIPSAAYLLHRRTNGMIEWTIVVASYMGMVAWSHGRTPNYVPIIIVVLWTVVLAVWLIKKKGGDMIDHLGNDNNIDPDFPYRPHPSEQMKVSGLLRH